MLFRMDGYSRSYMIREAEKEGRDGEFGLCLATYSESKHTESFQVPTCASCARSLALFYLFFLWFVLLLLLLLLLLYIILCCYYSLYACLFSNERLKGCESWWEGKSGDGKKSISNKRKISHIKSVSSKGWAPRYQVWFFFCPKKPMEMLLVKNLSGSEWKPEFALFSAKIALQK